MAPPTVLAHDAAAFADAAFAYDAGALEAHWARLHAGDAEPWPADPVLVGAWRLFHAGRFLEAAEAGLAANAAGLPGGLTLANKAQSVHATHLERSETARLALLLEVAERAEARTLESPDDAAAHYNLAYALGRYSQGISIARALDQGLGIKVRSALQTTLRLRPSHADAHATLGAFHAEVIDKVGPLLARTQGARKEVGLAAYRRALVLAPHSPILHVECAIGLVMLEGEARMAEATALYERAAAMQPMDAMEALDVRIAQAGLADG